MKQVAIMGSTGSRGTQSLDVGSGPGFVARRIIDDLGAEVHCIDVVDLNKTDLPVILFPAEKYRLRTTVFPSHLVYTCCTMPKK